ncbi:MAG: histidinol dehydrogenase [Lachnospiraceae bacterium]|nr:histidinol dehydrogenase [Lachnospiraceae bacterium]
MIRICRYEEISDEEIFKRSDALPDVSGTVAAIIADLRARGDAALLDYTERFDHVRPESLEVSEEEFAEALAKTDERMLEVLKKAASSIRTFHQEQKRSGFILNEKRGVVIGQKVIPMARVGLYVPGGTAAYPSTVLMDAIPARIAGVKELVIATPPGRDGKVNPLILAAARIAGVDKVYKAGGAQAIAALAYGTETIGRADKIVGPGNAFVAEAKRQIFGQAGIDMIAGPSEILVIADKKSDPVQVAADLLSQAEHDKNASAVLVTECETLAKKVQEEIERQLSVLPREEIARASIDSNGKIILTDKIETAVAIANRIAPEHLELVLDQPFDYLDMVENAGSVFLGRNCPEALGDYMAGPNHTLPTGGTARFSSPLSVDDFVKKIQYTYFSQEAFRSLARDVAYFAEQEGLSGHARSALSRLKENT